MGLAILRYKNNGRAYKNPYFLVTKVILKKITDTKIAYRL